MNNPERRRQAEGDDHLGRPARDLAPACRGRSLRRRGILLEASELAEKLLGPIEGAELAVPGDRNGTALLGYDDAQAVCDLRQPERRSVPCSASAELLLVRGQGEVQREAGDSSAGHENRAIVTGGPRVEEAQEERLAHQRVERHPSFDVSLQGLAPWNQDECAGSGLGEPRDGSHQCVADAGRRKRRSPSESPQRDLFEQPPQILLEDHHHDDHQDREEPAEDPRREAEAEDLRRQVDGADDHQSDEGEPRPGAPEPDEDGPEQDRDGRDIEEIRPAERKLDRDRQPSEKVHVPTPAESQRFPLASPLPSLRSLCRANL